MISDLECSVCGRSYEASSEEPWRCSCGGPLEFTFSPTPEERPPSSLDRDLGLWAFDSFLPVERRVSLGEGFTPLVEAPDWDVSFKLEYVFPSGSFKDRGATTTLSRAANLGVSRIVEDSSGNAGAAIAQYAALAGIEADIYVPAEAKSSKVAAIEKSGANAVRISGGRAAVTDACIEAVESGDAWYASHAWNPAFFAGTMTFALEIAAQRGWNPPEAVVLPVGHGTLFLGAYRGFRALKRAGWIDRLPRLLGVQAAGVSPVADEHHADMSTDRTNDLADGIQIAEPVRQAQIHDAIRATDGDAIAVDADSTETSLDALHRSGLYVEPTSAAAVAGLERYRERGLDEAADVVVPLTGSGLKAF